MNIVEAGSSDVAQVSLDEAISSIENPLAPKQVHKRRLKPPQSPKNSSSSQYISLVDSEEEDNDGVVLTLGPPEDQETQSSSNRSKRKSKPHKTKLSSPPLNHDPTKDIEMDTVASSGEAESEESEQTTLLETIDRTDLDEEPEPEKAMGCFLRKILPLFMTFSSYWLNFLLIVIPFPPIIYFAGWNRGVLFILSLLSIFPTTTMLKVAQCSLLNLVPNYLSPIVGIFLRNAVPLTIGAMCVYRDQARIIQGMIAGSILQRMLLTYGISMTINAKSKWARIDDKNPRVGSSILFLAVGLLALPTISSTGSAEFGMSGILKISRWSSIALIILLILLIIFSIRTHDKFWDRIPLPGSSFLGWIGSAIVVLVFIPSACLTAFLVTYSATWVSSNWGLGSTFVGGMLIPMACNAADTIDAVRVTFKGNLKGVTSDLQLSSLEMCLFTAPMLIIASWIFGHPVGLNFFPTTFVSCIFTIVNLVVMQSALKSNWFQGSIMIACYMMFAVSYFLQTD